jgi:hypothetical protein
MLDLTDEQLRDNINELAEAIVLRGPDGQHFWPDDQRYRWNKLRNEMVAELARRKATVGEHCGATLRLYRP